MRKVNFQDARISQPKIMPKNTGAPALSVTFIRQQLYQFAHITPRL